ncbi:MAG: ParA family protein, partial [bacterium]|nr:ParA family protein [bacterium]
DLVVKYIVPTFYDLRVKKSNEILDQLNKYFPEQLCEPIKYNVRLSEAPGFGRTIYEFDPKSTGARGYQALTEKVRNDGR